MIGADQSRDINCIHCTKLNNVPLWLNAPEGEVLKTEEGLELIMDGLTRQPRPA